MATGVSVTSSSIADRFKQRTFRISRPNSRPIPYALRLTLPNHLQRRSWKAKNLRLCLVMEKKTEDVIQVEKENTVESADNIKNQVAASRVTERLARKRSERYTYLVAAIMSSLGVTSTAAVAIFYKSSWQMEGGEFPLFEMLGTFALSVGASVGMEFWARWAHRALWHASLWNMHESHHRARDGTFELNDVFAITNAVPAIALLFYGSSQKGLIPGLCFGAVSLSRSLPFNDVFFVAVICRSPDLRPVTWGELIDPTLLCIVNYEKCSEKCDGRLAVLGLGRFKNHVDHQ